MYKIGGRRNSVEVYDGATDNSSILLRGDQTELTFPDGKRTLHQCAGAIDDHRILVTGRSISGDATSRKITLLLDVKDRYVIE